MNDLIEELQQQIDSLMISEDEKADLNYQLLELADTTQEENLERLFKAILFEKEKLHA